MILRNEKGITLLEVLLSIVILMMILISIINFFPQMGLMNRQNEDKTQAINLAKQILIEWESDEEIKYALAGFSDMNNLEGYASEDSHYFYFTEKQNEFDVEIKIKKDSDLQSNPSKAHMIHVLLRNNRDAVVSETYGYIIYDSGGSS